MSAAASTVSARPARRTGIAGATAQIKEQPRTGRRGREDPPAPDEVGEQASGHEQRGVDEIVAVHHPLQDAHPGGEMLADRAHRQIDDGSVDLRHQYGGGEVGRERRGESAA